MTDPNTMPIWIGVIIAGIVAVVPAIVVYARMSTKQERLEKDVIENKIEAKAESAVLRAELTIVKNDVRNVDKLLAMMESLKEELDRVRDILQANMSPMPVNLHPRKGGL